MNWKHDLYKKVAPHIAPNAIFASNTSGLSITTLADGFDAELKARFCGVHFFNPPRYMHLVEIIPTATTKPAIVDQLEGFLTTTLGKGVVRAKDTPNFIANRVGIFGMLAIIHEAEKFGLVAALAILGLQVDAALEPAALQRQLGFLDFVLAPARRTRRELIDDARSAGAIGGDEALKRQGKTTPAAANAVADPTRTSLRSIIASSRSRLTAPRPR